MKKHITIDNCLSFIAAICVVVWTLSPVAVMIRNYNCQIPVTTIYMQQTTLTYWLWLILLVFSGGLGLIVGLLYLIRRLVKSSLSGREKIAALLPIWLLFAFFFWCVVNTFCFAENTNLAINGQLMQMDCLLVYLCYGGLILAGLTVARNKFLSLSCAWLFLGLAEFMAVVSIIDNQFTYNLFVNSATNIFHYQGVFYNTNYYGYFLVMAIIVSACMFETRPNIVEKILAGIVFLTNVWMILLNDTMGGLIALSITLVVTVIWSFVLKEDCKWRTLIVLVAFIVVSLISLIPGTSTSEVIKNDAKQVSDDIAVISSSDSTEKEYGKIGNNRWKKWKWTAEAISEKPLVGHGLQSIQNYSTHNIYLQQTAYTGIIGIILYLSVFVAGIIRLIKDRENMNSLTRGAMFTTLAYMMALFVGNTLFCTAGYFYIILGFCFSGALRKMIEE